MFAQFIKRGEQPLARMYYLKPITARVSLFVSPTEGRGLPVSSFIT